MESCPARMPTVSHRMAQAVVKASLEPELKRQVHPDLYGYRPGTSALAAVGGARQRGWRYDWVFDLDIRPYGKSIDHVLVMRAVRKHPDGKWVLLFIKRWLNTPTPVEDGTWSPREQETPQGSVGSPLLANRFLHSGFDRWIQRHYPHIPFERFADDAISHCASEVQA